MKKLLIIVVVVFLTQAAAPLTSYAESHELKLWFRQPAEKWTEALPIGNGRIGAMVFGRVDTERIQFNEDTFWSGRPHDYTNPEALQYLDKVRSLIFEGKYLEAQELADEHMMGKPRFLQAYQPMGDLWLRFKHSGPIKNYRRELDLKNAIVRISYEVRGVKYKREVFCSAPDEVMVLVLTGDKDGKVFFEAELTSPHHYNVETQGNNQLIMKGQWIGSEDLEDEDSLIAPVKGKGTKFESHLLVRTEGGTVEAKDKTIQISGANSATLILTAGTSFKNFHDISGDAGAVCEKHIKNIIGKGYKQIYEDHLKDYQRLFLRVELEIDGDNLSGQPTDERLQNLRNGSDDRGLLALYFQYGRYLLISSSRPGTQPANLQGIWNELKLPPWGSKYTLNINAECNYWPAEVCNLAECHEPLFNLIEDLSVTGSKVAKAHYRCRGWVAHHNTDIWRAAAPVDWAFYGMWPSGGGWLCQHLWQHYEFGGDKEFLAKKAYPLMKSSAQFFLDYLVEEPSKGWLVTCPSNSPEIAHHEGVSICAAPTMDIQIITDLFNNCIKASKILDTDAEFRSQLETALKRLPPMQVGKYGQLQEWLFDIDEPEPRHRHISHTYGLFPGDSISPERTPKLAEATCVSLERRGDGGMGWGVAWKAACWARLKDGDRSEKLIRRVLATNTHPNLFCELEPFQIDGNFASTAAIAEMLLQSHAGEIHLLPALPNAWPTGDVKGLRARGAFEVDMSWKEGKLTKAKIYSHKGNSVKVRLNDKTIKLKTKPGQSYLFNSDLIVWVQTESMKPIKISFSPVAK